MGIIQGVLNENRKSKKPEFDELEKGLGSLSSLPWIGDNRCYSH